MKIKVVIDLRNTFLLSRTFKKVSLRCSCYLVCHMCFGLLIADFNSNVLPMNIRYVGIFTRECVPVHFYSKVWTHLTEFIYLHFEKCFMVYA